MRTIWHLDLDSFFVSAERLRKPMLIGRPVAVGGTGPRSVISSCSYEARKFGVRSAMPTGQALRLCPQLIMIPVDMDYYAALSKQVFELLPDYSPIFETVSIDEAYLDMTGTTSLFGPPRQAAEKLRQHIMNKTGLTSSIGIATNRLVAKIATDLGKPNGIYEVLPGSEAATLAPLPVATIPGCGRVTTVWLHDRGLRTIAQLQNYRIDILEKHLGKFGTYLHEAAWGQGSTAFHEESKTRTVSRERTFEEDENNQDYFDKLVWEMCTDIGQSLRQENVFARGTRLKLRYPDFQTVTRSRVLTKPTQSDTVLFEAAKKLFEDHWTPNEPLRLLGVGFVIGDGVHQMDLFAPTNPEHQLDNVKNQLNSRFGAGTLKTGRDFRDSNE